MARFEFSLAFAGTKTARKQFSENPISNHRNRRPLVWVWRGGVRTASPDHQIGAHQYRQGTNRNQRVLIRDNQFWRSDDSHTNFLHVALTAPKFTGSTVGLRIWRWRGWGPHTLAVIAGAATMVFMAT